MLGQSRHAALMARNPGYRAVYERFHGPDGSALPNWLKAPNGKPSNLDPVQFVQVRTPRFMAWFGDWEKKARVDRAVDFALNGNPVATLTGDEFAQTGNNDLVDRVAAYYEGLGGSVENDELGTVLIDREGVKSSLGHGIGRAKAAAFAAVPDVIRKGLVFDRRTNWKGRGVDSCVLCAPISIGGDTYVCEAIVERKAQGKERRFYLHEVNLQSSLAETIKTPTGGAANDKPSRPVRSILAKCAAEVKGASKVVDENGEPLVVYHGTHSREGFTVFTVKNGTYFSSNEESAKGYTLDRGKVYATFLNIRNPQTVDAHGSKWSAMQVDHPGKFWKALGTRAITPSGIASYAKDNGNDGAIVLNVRDNADNGDPAGNTYITFSPTQIKSATDNTGAFDPENPDIRYCVAEKIRPATREEYDAVIRDWGELKDCDASLGKWIFPDGRVPMPKMADALGGAVRYPHHDSIFRLLDRPERTNPNEALDYGYADTLCGGAIRINLGNGGLEFAVRPTDAQVDTLAAYVYDGYGWMKEDGLDILDVDLHDFGSGQHVAARYRRGTSPFDIVRDVRDFYDSGAIPLGNAATPRFSVVTHAEDAAYADAVKRGDRETALRMIREAAHRAMPNTKVVDWRGDVELVYHGTPNGKFTVFDEKRIGETWGLDDVGFFFTNNAKIAKEYTKPYFREETSKPNLFKVYLNLENPLVVDGKWWKESFGRDDIYNYDAIEIWDKEQRTIIDSMKDGGHDGVIISTSPYGVTPKMFVALSPNQIKSADITYDDAGNLVPLSQRFNAESPDIRFSIAPVYTGSAADYDKPSLLHVGSGEGSQVYGWGLYGSGVRGVAEGYAKIGSEEDLHIVHKDGSELGNDWNDILFTPRHRAEQMLEELRGYSIIREEKSMIDMAIDDLESRDEEDAAKWLDEHRGEYRLSAQKVPHLYEQTFFTNRAPGDESHLLLWYEPVSEENLKRISDAIAKTGRKIDDGVLLNKAGTAVGPMKLGMTGQGVYQVLTKAFNYSEEAASEFLARADIDGIKYPVDSYGGKGVKNGDEAGWNYVSFRDDNIRIDHKWVDGQKRFSIASEVHAVMAKNEKGKYLVSGGKAIHFAKSIPILSFLGVEVDDVFTIADRVRKIINKHGLTEDQVSRLFDRDTHPVAVYLDVDGKGSIVILTDMIANDEDGKRKPVMVFLSRAKGSRSEFIASAYCRNDRGESAYVAWKSKLAYLDENKIANLGLKGETDSQLQPSTVGDDVRTYEDFSSWSTPHSIPHSPALAQGVRFSLGYHTQNAVRDFADGRDSFIENPYGRIVYAFGNPGHITENGRVKGGHGLMHIVYSRMVKDGATLDEVVDTAIRVGDAIETGEETETRDNKKYFRKDGIEGIFARNYDGQFVLTGYKIIADGNGGDKLVPPSLRTTPPPRKEDVVAAMNRWLENQPTQHSIPYPADGCKGVRFSIAPVYTGSVTDIKDITDEVGTLVDDSSKEASNIGEAPHSIPQSPDLAQGGGRLWLMDKKRLVIDKDGQLYSMGKDNSASDAHLPSADAENQSAGSADSISQSAPRMQPLNVVERDFDEDAFNETFGGGESRRRVGVRIGKPIDVVTGYAAAQKNALRYLADMIPLGSGQVSATL